MCKILNLVNLCFVVVIEPTVTGTWGLPEISLQQNTDGCTLNFDKTEG